MMVNGNLAIYQVNVIRLACCDSRGVEYECYELLSTSSGASLTLCSSTRSPQSVLCRVLSAMLAKTYSGIV